jgi:hypothetical protein
VTFRFFIPTFFTRLGSLQYVIWMGHDQRGSVPSVPRKQPVKAIPSSIVFAYAHHAALAPLERRKRSTARTLAFLEMMMRWGWEGWEDGLAG